MNSTPAIGSIDKHALSSDEIISHIRERLLAARDDVEGIILFGSFARSEDWHDIDVLVVLRERIPTRNFWAAIMRECQDAIGARYIIEDEAGESLWIPSEQYFQPEAAEALAAARNAFAIARDFVACFGQEGLTRVCPNHSGSSYLSRHTTQSSFPGSTSNARSGLP